MFSLFSVARRCLSSCARESHPEQGPFRYAIVDGMNMRDNRVYHERLGLGKCVHCLKDVAERNSDHVFPASWYPDSTPPNLEKWHSKNSVRRRHDAHCFAEFNSARLRAKAIEIAQRVRLEKCDVAGC